MINHDDLEEQMIVSMLQLLIVEHYVQEKHSLSRNQLNLNWEAWQIEASILLICSVKTYVKKHGYMQKTNNLHMKHEYFYARDCCHLNINNL
jgi:hypothetical protein